MNFKDITIIALLITVVLLLTRGCEKPINNTSVDYSNAINLVKNKIVELKTKSEINEIRAKFYKSKSDSLKSIKKKILTKYVNEKNTDTLYVNVYAPCDTINALNDKIIDSQDFVIKHLESTLIIKNEIISQKDSIIEFVNQNSQNYKKTVKRDKRKLIVRSFGIGLLTGLLINLIK